MRYVCDLDLLVYHFNHYLFSTLCVAAENVA